MKGGVKTQYPAGNKNGRLVKVLYYSSLFTLTQSLLDLRSFGANLALLRLRFLGGTFGLSLVAWVTKTL